MPGTRRRGKGKHDKNDISNPKKAGHISQNYLLLLSFILLLAAGLAYHSLTGYDFRSRPGYQTQVFNGSDPFVVVDLPGRGKGMLATRDIEQGERILTEKPIFIAPNHVVGPPAPVIAKLLREATPEDRAAFLNLSYVNFPKHLNPAEHPDEVALAIFQTNAIATKLGAGIFPRLARMNHGCSSAFNAVYNWKEREQVLAVHALKKVLQGEEILTTYTDTKRPRAERRSFLQQNYGFTCMCKVCALSDKESEASDRRLIGIVDAYGRFSTWGHKGEKRITGAEAIRIAKMIWALEDDEGYWSERGRLAADAAYVAAAHSNDMPTREWAKLATRWYGYELGKDSEQVREMEGVATRPQSHPGWGIRDPQIVEGPESADRLSDTRPVLS